MNTDEARSTLEYLIRKYVLDATIQLELLAMIHDPKLQGVPVRGVLHDLQKLKKESITETDGNLIRDLVFYFG